MLHAFPAHTHNTTQSPISRALLLMMDRLLASFTFYIQSIVTAISKRSIRSNHWYANGRV